MREAKPQTAKPKPEPVEQSVHVECSPEEAFQLFTERFAEWWPFSDQCLIEPWPGGKLLETTPSGEEIDLGSIEVWDPPRRVAFTWHPSERRDRNQTVRDQTVDVAFRVDAVGTRVTITHHDWHVSGVETCAARFCAFACDQLFAIA